MFVSANHNCRMPIRFKGLANKGVRFLHQLAYPANVQGKSVKGDKRNADAINNGIFKNRKIAAYMKTNKLDKPTLVVKTNEALILALSSLLRHPCSQAIQQIYRLGSYINERLLPGHIVNITSV